MKFIKNNTIIALLLIFLFILLCIGSCSALKKEKKEENTTNTTIKKVSNEDRAAVRDILANQEATFSPLKDCYKDALNNTEYTTNGVVSVMIKNLYNKYIEEEPYSKLTNCNEQCKKLLGSGNNKLISSANLEIILNDYDYNEKIKSCFTPVPNYENEYYVLEGPDRLPKLECNYKVNHSFTMEYIDDNHIEVTDKQEVIKYDSITYESDKAVYGNVLETKDRVVIYTIEKNGNNYILKDVINK